MQFGDNPVASTGRPSAAPFRFGRGRPASLEHCSRRVTDFLPSRSWHPNESVPSPEPGQLDARDRALFDAVLHETEAALGGDDAHVSSVVRQLRRLAGEYPGEPLLLRPVTVALTRELLAPQVSRTVAASRLWSQVCDRVAQSLFDDPVARERLERLWGRLQADLP